MVAFTEAEVLAWMTPLFWPFLRALALVASLPVLGTRTVPARVRPQVLPRPTSICTRSTAPPSVGVRVEPPTAAPSSPLPLPPHAT